MTNNQKKKEDFAFEMEFCLKKPRVFLTEAITLKYSAKVTLEFENAKSRGYINVEQGIFSDDIIQRGYFPYRTIRMVMAYSLENLAKYIVILKYKIDNPQETKLPIKKIKTHNLFYLFDSIGYVFPKDYKVYISSWNKCSVWAGRYPLPASESQMYGSREIVNGMGSVRFSFGNTKRLSESDILHTNISDYEYKAYLRIFGELREIADTEEIK
jgi:hypothetical protein